MILILPSSPSFSSSNVQIDAVEHMQFDSRLHKQKKIEKDFMLEPLKRKTAPQNKSKIGKHGPFGNGTYKIVGQ